MSIAEKKIIMSANNVTIAENEQRVYDKGREDGGNEAYPIGFAEGKQEGMEQGYREGFRFGREDGIEEGIEQGKQEELANCQAKHFVGSAIGDGTNTLSFEVPFEPDMLLVNSPSGYALSPNSIRTVTMDAKACGRYACAVCFADDVSEQRINNFVTEGIIQRERFKYENGKVFLYINTSSYPKVAFISNTIFTIIASKLNKTPKERVIEDVNALPNESNGTTLQYNRTRINENFTTEEWESLITTKPNWTFSLI